MNKESPFSVEYDINNATDSKSSVQQKSSTPKDKEASDLIKKLNWIIRFPNQDVN